MKKILIAFFLYHFQICISFAQDDFQQIQQIPSGVKSITIVTPIYSQKLSFSLPASWDNALQERKGIMFMMEFKPKNENINFWKNLLTIQGFENLSKRFTAQQFLTETSNRFKSVCKTDFVFTDLGETVVDGFKSQHGILGCSKVPGQNFSETAYWLVIQGENDLYVIQKAIRSNPGDVLTKSNLEMFVQDIKPIALCKKIGEVHECLK